MPLLATTPAELPRRLGKPPLVDAHFEVRFRPAKKGTAQLLPGYFFSQMSPEYVRSEALPPAGIPEEIRAHLEPSLKYQYHYRLSGEGSIVLVGEHSAGVGALPPYQGWEFFQPKIAAFLTVLKSSGLVQHLERFSLKFVNVLGSSVDRQLGLLNLNLALGGIPVPDQGFHLRTELNDTALIRIVEVRPNTTVELASGATQVGLLVSIDCIREVRSGSLQELSDDAIESVHQELKEIFFGLITPSTLASLDPHASPITP